MLPIGGRLIDLFANWLKRYRIKGARVPFNSPIQDINIEYFATVTEVTKNVGELVAKLKNRLPRSELELRDLISFTRDNVLEMVYDKQMIVQELLESTAGHDFELSSPQSVSSLFIELIDLKKSVGEMFSPVFYEKASRSNGSFSDSAMLRPLYLKESLH